GGKNNLAAFGPESYPQPGVRQGKVHGPFEHASKLYSGMKANFWFYVPAQTDGTPSPVMVWQVVLNYAAHDNPARLLHVVDNLIAQKRIPSMVSVFIAPGKEGERAMRSVLYDTVTDQYSRYVLEEILPEVEKT